MNRRILSVTIALIIFVSMANSPVSTHGQTTAKIGLLTPLTGSLDFLGPTFQAGAELAIADLNAMQSIYDFELIVQDTQTDSTFGQIAAEALVDQGVLGVVGAATSSSTLSSNPTFVTAKIPQISYASTSPAISNTNDNDYLFRVVLSDSFQGKAAAQFVHELGIGKIAIIGRDGLYGQGLVEAFTVAYTNDGGIVSLSINYDPVTTVDFSSQINQIVDASVDAVYMVSFISDGAAILAELHDQNYNGIIIGSDGIATNSIYSEVGINPEVVEGVMGTSPTITGTAEFVTAFETANSGMVPGIFVAEAYDATMLLGLAAIHANSLIGSDVRDVLRTVADTYVGASGIFNFDANGDRDTGKYDIWQFWNGELTVIGDWEDNTLTVTTLDPIIIDVTSTRTLSEKDDTTTATLDLFNYSAYFFIIFIAVISSKFKIRSRKYN